MRKLFLHCFFLFPAMLFAQQLIKGTVKDGKTNTPLPFATIVTNTGYGTITDVDGNYQILKTDELQTIRVSYVGYFSKTISINEHSVFYNVTLDENVESLGEVVLNGKENPALEIIRKAIAQKDKNDPEKVLNTFKFNSYRKMLVTANPDSINGAVDSVFVKKDGRIEFSKVDSSNYELKKQLNRSHLYMTEKVSSYAFTQEKGKRENILATRMAGFKEPIYEILALQIQSFSFYENKYTLFGVSYTNPIAGGALSKYNYRILDTVQTNSREGYMIYYFPKEKGKTVGLEGVLYIDSESFALQKAIAQLKGVVDVKATQNFSYYPGEKLWFPESKEIKIEKGENNDAVAFFGSTFRITGTEQVKDSTTIHTNKTDASETIHLIAREQNFDITFNEPVVIRGRGLAIDVEEQATKRDEAFWNRYRTDSITARGEETYTYLDSIVAAEKIEKKIASARKLLKGYLPTKYLDLDLRYLLKYNNFEGFRLGMGAVTNENFSTKYRLNGYGVYGTKDTRFKYGIGAATRLDKRTDTWFGANYYDDLVETGSFKFITDGRAFSLFEPRLFNISLFHHTKSISTYLTHDITPKINSRLELERTDISPTYNYAYVNNGNTVTDYKINTLTFALQWNPFSDYMQAATGPLAIKTGYPQFTLQATQSLRGFMDGDFSFTKVDFRIIHEIQPIDGGKTTFLFVGGLAFGDIPLTHLYHASPNQPNGNEILKRFSVAGRDSFETMYFNEFFSDRYATLQGKHYFKRFNLVGKIRPEVVLISRFAIGDVSNKENHIGFDFNSLDKGYLESGMEINKIFKGFGLSAMYRYGAYHLPRFDDNISFKFTYYFTLGF